MHWCEFLETWHHKIWNDHNYNGQVVGRRSAEFEVHYRYDSSWELRRAWQGKTIFLWIIVVYSQILPFS